MGKLKNILFELLKSGKRNIIIDKIYNKLSHVYNDKNQEKSLNWIREHEEDLGIFMKEKSPSFYEEAQQVELDLKKRINSELNDLNFEFGGGGAFPFLYFCTRYLSPDVVVETGVAAGFSSQAILQAMSLNKKGILFSSDFPYFRQANAEKYIGILVLVNEDLKNRWELYTNGDKNNLPKILAEVENIDVLHYDSDKSYKGRKYAIGLITDKLSDDGIIIMDDIQDNSFFFDYITQNEIDDFKIFKFEGKYLGCINIKSQFVKESD